MSKWSEDDWGTPNIVKPSRAERFSTTRKIEENILKELSKNSMGFKIKRYAVYDERGKEVAQTILTKSKNRVRCPDIYASHPSSWDDISLRIEVKDHVEMFNGFVRTECKKFHDYIYLQSQEEIEIRMIFFIIVSGRKMWQTIDVLDKYKVFKNMLVENGKREDFYYWDVSHFYTFTTADDFFEDVQY